MLSGIVCLFMSLDDVTIVTVAPTGSGPQWQVNPHLPITPSEIADQTIAACNAGASVAHIHVRDPKTKTPNPSVELYREVIERIRDKCDMIIQLTTGGGGPYGTSFEQRMCALELVPEFASLNVATMTFGDSIFVNPPDQVEKIAALMIAKRIKPEVECYDVGHVDLALRLVDKKLLKEPLRISLVLGVRGGIPAKPEHLLHLIKCLPSGCRANVVCVGRAQFPMLSLGVGLGADIRVGMEDNIYLAKGVLAKNNAELVTKAVNIAEASGKKVATPSEARKIIGLG